MACRNLGQSAGLPAATSLAHRDCSVAHSICNNLPICGRYAVSSEAARGGMGAKISGGSTGRSPEETKTERDDPWGCGSEKEVLGVVLLANGVRCYLVTDECRLARHALPLGILLNPHIGKPSGAHDSLSFLSYLVLVHPGSNGNIPVQVNRHSAAGKLVVMIDSVSDMSQPLALVHKAPIVVREIKGLRKQRTESLRIVCDFGLIPSVLKGQNRSGLIRSHTSVRSSDGRRE